MVAFVAEGVVFGFTKPFLAATKSATNIGYFVNFMNKLLLDCVRFGFTPIKPNLVALTSLHYNATSCTKTPSTYTPNPPKSCIQTCN